MVYDRSRTRYFTGFAFHCFGPSHGKHAGRSHTHTRYRLSSAIRRRSAVPQYRAADQVFTTNPMCGCNYSRCLPNQPSCASNMFIRGPSDRISLPMELNRKCCNVFHYLGNGSLYVRQVWNVCKRLCACICVYKSSQLCGPAQQNRLIPTHPPSNGQFDPLTPLLFASRAEVIEHMVHLLECFAGSLRHEPVDPEQREKTEYGKEDVRAVACAFYQRRSDEADDEVKEPIRAG